MLRTILYRFLFFVWVLTVIIPNCHRKKRIKVSGRVVDAETGIPVTGADLKLHARFSQIMQHYKDDLSAVSDQQGEFRFGKFVARKLFLQESYSSVAIEVTSDGFQPANIHLRTFTECRKPIEIRLARAPVDNGVDDTAVV